MAIPTRYIEGNLRVHLSLFRSQDNNDNEIESGIFISDFEGILQNSDHKIVGHVGPELYNEIRRVLNWDSVRSALIPSQDATAVLNNHGIFCFLSESSLNTAKELYGKDFECIIQICCIPPPRQRKLSDGEIFRTMRYLIHQKNFDVAQEWMNELSPPKKHHLSLMLGRPAIISAMDELLPFPGLWSGLQLGNWAKHLAAHTDELIINYLKHIKKVYLGIFQGHESLKHLLDEDTVLQLQYRSLRWSIRDQKLIHRLFKKELIFKKISSRRIRDDLLKNVLSIPGVVPSIATFHANMKYLTIGAKILEKYIEIKPKNHRAQRHSITRSKSSLYDNLRTHWTPNRKSIQISQEKFVQMRDTPSASRLCFLQLLMAALRYFPHLSSESPLLDRGGGWVGITPDESFQALLCTTAWNLGYDNEKIRRQADREPILLGYKSVSRLEIWRGGKPPFQVFELLAGASFLPQLSMAALQKVDFPSPLQIQGDMLSAFFGTFEDLSTLMFENVNMNQLNVPFSSVEDNYEDDEDMDDVGDSGAEEYSNDIELRDAEGNFANPKAIRPTKRKKRRGAASSKSKASRLPKSSNRLRQTSRIINNPTRQSLFDELANTHPIPTRHSTLTIDMDIQPSESVPDNLYVVEMQQQLEEEQQAAGTYSNSLNIGSSFDTDIIHANPTPSRDSVLPQPEPLVPPTLATSNTLYSISEEQQVIFEEDTRANRDKHRQRTKNTLAVKNIINEKQRDDEADFKDAAVQRKAINEEAVQKIEAVLQNKIDGRKDINLINELGLIEQNRRRANGKVEKARHNGANLRIEMAMRKIKILLPTEEADQREKALKEEEETRRKLVSEEEYDAKEKSKEKLQAAIKAMAEIEAARQESARQEALRMQPQADSRTDGTEIVESFPSPSDDGPRTPPDLPDGMSGEVQEGIDSIN